MYVKNFFVYVIRKLFWIPQIMFRILQISLFWRQFEQHIVIVIYMWNIKQ